jgi:arsenate reductase-like glutaredoxin family protein
MKGYSEHHRQQLKKALEYLDNRKINIMKHNFKPTNAAQTDVAATMARYRQQTQGQQIIREVRKFK